MCGYDAPRACKLHFNFSFVFRKFADIIYFSLIAANPPFAAVFTLSEKATASRKISGRKAGNSETSLTGCRSEVTLYPKTVLFITIIAMLAGSAAAQMRESAKPILVDVIGPGPKARRAAERPREIQANSSANRRSVKKSATYGVERTTFQLMNSERAMKGLAPLRWNDTLADVARLHSQNMAANNFFSHRGVDGLMVDDRAAGYGVVEWRAIGENIAYLKGYDQPEAIAVEKWMNSSSHRRNMLSDQWTESAIGVAQTPDGTYYFTQVFLVR